MLIKPQTSRSLESPSEISGIYRGKFRVTPRLKCVNDSIESKNGSPDPLVKTATAAVFVAFIGAGILQATWAARIPQLKAALDMDAAIWGLVLLSMAAGSVSALTVTGLIINKLGEKRTVQIFSVLGGLGLVGLGLGYVGGVVPVVITLYLIGFGMGAWDVAMNVQGTLVEHRLGKVILPKFHAGFSVGTVAGALLGALLIQLGVGITANLVAIGLLVGGIVSWRVTGFLKDAAGSAAGSASPSPDTFADPADALVGFVDGEGEGTPSPRKLTLGQAWREPRTLLVGLFVLIFSFAEGTAIDWIGVAMVDDYKTSTTIGTLGLATFLATMTISRWFGTALLDRFGRVLVLRMLAVVALTGVLLFTLSGNVVVAFLGVALWGCGVSLGFPMGMSAGGDEPVNSAVRVSVVATIGYVAFLAGPPFIGLLGHSFGVLSAIMAVAALLPVAFLIAGQLKELNA